jgi:hypothetical protein
LNKLTGSNYDLALANDFQETSQVDAHGTNVAGIIAGSLNSVNGFRGVAPESKFASINIIDHGTNSIFTSMDKKIALYDFAAEKNFQIINESYFRGYSFSSLKNNDYKDIFEKLEMNSKTQENQKGFVVVKGAGNETCKNSYALKYIEENNKNLKQFSELSKKLSEQRFNEFTEAEKELLSRIRP